MTNLLSNLKSSGRAALVVVGLAAASMGFAATPAAAQSFQFDFGISGGPNFSMGVDRPGFRGHPGFRGYPDHGRHFSRECLTDREIIRGLRRNGFEDVRIGKRRGDDVRVFAEWRGRDYRMTVDTCTGQVSDIERLRRRR